MVSIHGPLGYGPSTLPLRHSADDVFQENVINEYLTNVDNTYLEKIQEITNNG